MLSGSLLAKLVLTKKQFNGKTGKTWKEYKAERKPKTQMVYSYLLYYQYTIFYQVK